MTFTNRLPVGPGSRGGRWHDLEWRRLYFRAWRAAHPEYRARERLRRWRFRHPYDPDPPRSLPLPTEACACGCGCRESVVTVCGFCRDGQCEETA